jgi:hypothetical protein
MWGNPLSRPSAAVAVAEGQPFRIPDDGRDHLLPPGFGRFPLRHVDDFAGRLPAHLTERGGVILPMYQAEAMWLSFSSHDRSFPYPVALKVATGKINAVTGRAWSHPLSNDPQDYLTSRFPSSDGSTVTAWRKM